MNLQFYFEKLSSSDEFKKFKKENSKAYLSSAFVSIDKEKSNNEVHFDFFIPEKNEITSFQMNEEMKMVPLENFGSVSPEKISKDTDIDFNKIESLISERMENEKMKNKIQKIILSLQKTNGKEFLSGTVFISMLGLIKIIFDLEKMEIVDFEKKSIMDMIKIMKK